MRQNFKSRRGQTAVVIILVIAIALILYAVVLNLNKTLQFKNVTEISSNLVAAQLASSMASYGQSVMQNSLGGRLEDCGPTGVLLVAAIIAVLIIAYFTGVGAALLGPLLEMAIVLAVAALVIQATVVQPGLSKMWNRLMSEQLIPLDEFVERGIQTGLTSVVSDIKMFPDQFDLDGDRSYVDNFSGIINDQIGRFSIYYTDRLKKIKPREGLDVTEFLAALEDLLYKGDPVTDPDDFGFWDKPNPDTHPCGDYDSNNSKSPFKPSICDPCCVPREFEGEIRRQSCCGPWFVFGSPLPTAPPPDACGNAEDGWIQGQSSPTQFPLPFPARECGKRSGPGWADPFPNSPYKYIFETIYVDNQHNNVSTAVNPIPILSFREILGRDDEHKGYIKQPVPPPGPNPPPYSPNGVQMSGGPGNYILEDSTGYYRDPTYHSALSSTPDAKTGIYSFLYKMADWNPEMNPISASSLRCHWCDSRAGCGTMPVVTYPAALRQPSLPSDFGTNWQNYESQYSGNHPVSNPWRYLCVDQENIFGRKPIRPDNVGVTNKDTTIDRFNQNQNLCADNTRPANPLSASKPLWKRGSDRYCSDTVPPAWQYGLRCVKHNAGGTGDCAGATPAAREFCTCRESNNQSIWPEDTLDDLVLGIADFIAIAHPLIKLGAAELGQKLPEWYPKVANWIEPAGSFSGRATNGILLQWRDNIGQWRDAFESWLDDPRYEDASPVWGSSAGVGTPNDDPTAWCYPNLAERYNPALGKHEPRNYMSHWEYDYITAAGNAPGARRIDKVLACLYWNVNAPANVNLAVTNVEKGNAWQFFRCANLGDDPFNNPNPLPSMLYCISNWGTMCGHLPRSLLPFSDFDQTDVTPPDINTIALIGDCILNNCGPSCMTLSQPPYSISFPATCPYSGNFITTTLVNAMMAASGSCTDTTSGGWRDDVMQSSVEAVNQVEKFRKRLEFFQGYANPIPQGTANTIGVNGPNGGAVDLVAQAKQAWAELDLAHQELVKFLETDGPAENLTEMMRNFGASQPPLPSQAVYVWQSDPPKNVPVTISDATGLPVPPEGTWHISRVDVRIPQRCGATRACGPSGDAPDSPWPTIETREVSWGLKRCWFMVNTRGSVKARVTRFDEDRSPGLLKFPSGEKIWDFRFSNPLAPRALDVGGRIKRDCLDSATTTCDIEIPSVDGAFIIGSANDCRTGEDCNGKCLRCWQTVNDILRSGVTTETCAEYFVKDPELGAIGQGFNVKFIKCKNFD